MIKVLMVEGDNIARMIQNRIVSQCNCLSDSASTSTQALNLIKSTAYDLILIDIASADINGIELTKQVRKTNGENQVIPIVALTTHSSDTSYYKNAIAADMDLYISKPLTTDKYYEILKFCGLN